MKNKTWILVVAIALLAIGIGVLGVCVISLSKDKKELERQLDDQSGLIEKDIEALENANKQLNERVYELQFAGDSLESVLKEKLAIIAEFEEKYDETVDDIYHLPIDSAMVYFSREVSSEISARK